MQTKINQYKLELTNLNQQKNKISIDLQVNEQRLETAREEVKQIFGTDSIDELKKIKSDLVNEVAENEAKLKLAK